MSDPIIPEVIPAIDTAPEAAPSEMVSRAELDKVLAEMHKFKSEAREMRTRTQAEFEKSLREQKRWEELVTIKDGELNDLRQRDTETKKAFIQEKKYSAVKEEALKAGIRPEALADLELVGLDKVEIETTSTGRINVLGVQGAIESLKMSRPHWFGQSKTSINGNLPSVNNSTGLVTSSEVNRLSLEARKTGDYAAYEKAHKQFQQQK